MNSSFSNISSVDTRSIVDEFQNRRDKELSKKYLVPLEIIQSKRQNGKLDQYLEKKQIKYGVVLKQSAKDYQEISKHYPIKNVEQKEINDLVMTHLFSSDNSNGEVNFVDAIPNQVVHESSDFPRSYISLLMKIIRKSNLELEKKEKSLDGVFITPTKTLPYHLLVDRDRKGLLKVFVCSENIGIKKDGVDAIGSGTYGSVRKIVDLLSREVGAIKIAFHDDLQKQELAVEYLQHEVRVLENLHSNYQIKGVQKPPTCYFDTIVNGNRFVAYTQRYYRNKDMYCCIEEEESIAIAPVAVEANPELILDRRKFLTIALHLFETLVSLHDRNIVHGDIKAGNIFVDLLGGLFDLGDFAGSLDVSTLSSTNEIKNLPKFPFGTIVSPNGFTDTDEYRLNEAIGRGSKVLWVYVKKQIDVYSLGKALTGIIGSLCNDHVGFLGRDILNFFREIVASDPYCRPTAIEIVEVLRKELS